MSVGIDEVAANCKHQFCDAAGNRVYLYCQRGCGTRDPLEPATAAELVRVDLDVLAREVRRAMDDADELPISGRQALALIARIRELEGAVRALAIGSLVGEITADRAKAILEKGVVLP